MSDDTPAEHGQDDPHVSFVQHAPDPREVQRVFSTYWFPLLKGEAGGFNFDRLKGELYDAWFLVNEARKVYRHVTGNLTDDLTASAEGIIALAERHVARRIYAAVHRGEDMEAPLDWAGVNAFLEAHECVSIPKEKAAGMFDVISGELGVADDEA